MNPIDIERLKMIRHYEQTLVRPRLGVKTCYPFVGCPKAPTATPIKDGEYHAITDRPRHCPS